jgi:CheY-like chemotaxis protein
LQWVSDRLPRFGEKPRLLVIDSDSAAVNVLCETLRAWPLEVKVVHEGKDALAAGAGEFDLLLLDFELPDIDGLDLIRALHADHIDVPFIIISGSLTLSRMRDAYETGAITVLEKPVVPHEVLLVIARALWHRSVLTRTCVRDRISYGANGAAVHDDALHSLESCSSVDRVADLIVKAVSCSRDPKTIEAWGRQVNASAGSIRGYCRLTNVPAHDARNVARVIRGLVWSGSTWSPDRLFECSDLRTLRAFMKGAGLDGKSGGPTPSIEEFLGRQQWIPQNHPVLLALRPRVHHLDEQWVRRGRNGLNLAARDFAYQR